MSEQPSVKLVVHIPCPHGHLDRHRACDPEKTHALRDSCWCPGARYREIDPDEVLPFRAPVGRYRVTGADVLEAVRRLEGFEA